MAGLFCFVTFLDCSVITCKIHLMQKKLFTLTGFLLMGYTTWSQQRYYHYEWNVERVQYDPVKHAVPKGIKEARYTVTQKGKVIKSVKQYNENGQVIKFYRLDNPKLKRSTSLTYDKNHQLSKVVISKKGQDKFTYLYERRADGKILSAEKIKYGKTKYKILTSYNADGNPTETIRYGKGGKKINSKVITEYYDKFSKSKTTVYNSKGKVKKVWLYDCKEEGELQTVKKNENRLCIRKDISDNILTEVYQGFNAKGKAEKVVYKYHAADTSIFEMTRYDSKDRIKIKWTYNGSEDKPLEYTFCIRGKVNFEWKHVYENDQLASETFLNKKGKQTGRITYHYNQDGCMVRNQRFGKKDKPIQAVNIEYVQ